MKAYTTVDFGVRKKLRKLKKRFFFLLETRFVKPEFYVGQIVILLDDIAECGYCMQCSHLWIRAKVDTMCEGRTLKDKWKHFLRIIRFKPHKFTVCEPEYLD